MRGREALAAIVVIWAAVMAMLLLYFAFVMLDTFFTSVVVVSLAGLGLGGTYLVLDHVREMAKHAARAQQQEQEKAKHRENERLERLLETLGDDEIVELETLLLTREDGPAHLGQTSRDR